MANMESVRSHYAIPTYITSSYAKFAVLRIGTESKSISKCAAFPLFIPAQFVLQLGGGEFGRGVPEVLHKGAVLVVAFQYGDARVVVFAVGEPL